MRQSTHILLITAAVALFALPVAHAQPLQAGESSLVYYMPRTELVFYVEYAEEVRQAGPFFHFAEQYFGTTEAVEADETRYHLLNVTTGTHVSPDPERAYKVLPDKDIHPLLLSLTDKGILRGYNIGADNSKRRTAAEDTPEASADLTPLAPMIVPVLEENAGAHTLEQMAEGIMKQIYHLRETRLYLLSGEVEHAPADGQAMELVLAELNRQEQQLTELFLGRRIWHPRKQRITYLPTRSVQIPIARFSEEHGLTAPTDTTLGTPLMLTLDAHSQRFTGSDKPAGKKAPAVSQIYYNLPGTADYVLTWNDSTLAARSLQLPQLGLAVPLPLQLFNAKDAQPRIHINPQTGNIQSITK